MYSVKLQFVNLHDVYLLTVVRLWIIFDCNDTSVKAY